MLTRRAFLAGTALAWVGPAHARAGASTFRHGVASGDPLADRVILWTRLTLEPAPPAATVRWFLARDAALRNVVARGEVMTGPARDYTVKVDAGGLAPGRPYYYAFEYAGTRSPVGRTRTLPAGRVDAFRLGFVSCASYPQGYYNAYARLAERADIDLVLHLGDYLYEHARGEAVSANAAVAEARQVVPAREVVTLADYRRRYALYRSDPDLQEVHRQHAFVCVWDDHEITNDAWRGGAANHDAERGEGAWDVRVRAAVQAYREWLPIRDGASAARIHRSFAIGDLADLAMLDTRLAGRDVQAGSTRVLDGRDSTRRDPRRTLLGPAQEAWLDEVLARSMARDARWQLLGQQVMMAQLSADEGRTFANRDQWDGYPAARARLYASMRARQSCAVVLSGDTHSSWCGTLAPNPWGRPGDRVGGAGRVAVEYVVPAVSSNPPIADAVQADAAATLARAVSPHLQYVNLNRRGYGVLDVTRSRVHGEIWHVDTVDRRADGQERACAFVTVRGEPALVATTDVLRRQGTAEPAPSETRS